MANKYRFIKVRCQSCKNEQTIFEGATTKVKCLICDAILEGYKIILE